MTAVFIDRLIDGKPFAAGRGAVIVAAISSFLAEMPCPVE